MKRLAILPIIVAILFATALLGQDKRQCTQMVFGGEVNAGEKFTRDIGNSLNFRLDPLKGSAGWEFEIGPNSAAPNEWDQYVYVLTPPYRNSSAREVNTGWGVTAQDAVRRQRQFWFLISRKDAPAAVTAIDEVLWPKSEQEQTLALQKLASLPAGTGEFTILESKITPGTPVPGYSDCQHEQCGEIHWIKFRVTLTVPAGFIAGKDLQATSVQCPKSASPLSSLARPKSR